MADQTKILFIDDELDIIYPLAYWFKSQGYAPVTACNSEEALTAIKEGAPDVIFCDIHMPVKSGFEILKDIRAIDQKVPVIMMSAYIGDDIGDKGKGYNIAGVFYKGDDFSKALALAKSALFKT